MASLEADLATQDGVPMADTIDEYGIWGPDGVHFIALHLGFERERAATLAQALSRFEHLDLHWPGREDSWEEWMEPLDPEGYERDDKRQHFIVRSTYVSEIDEAWGGARAAVPDVEGVVSSARAFYTSKSMDEWQRLSEDERFDFLLVDDAFEGEQSEIPELAAVVRRYFDVPDATVAFQVAQAWHESVVADHALLDTRALIAALSQLRYEGVPDAYLQQVRGGQPVTPALAAAVGEAHRSGIPAEYAAEMLRP